MLNLITEGLSSASQKSLITDGLESATGFLTPVDTTPRGRGGLVIEKRAAIALPYQPNAELIARLERSVLSADFLPTAIGHLYEPARAAMNPDIIRLKRNDHLRPVSFTLTEGGEPANLAAASSVKLVYQKVGGAAIARVIETWTADGKCQYQWTATDLLTSGKYRFEIEVTFTSGRVQTYPEDGYGEFLITDDLG